MQEYGDVSTLHQWQEASSGVKTGDIIIDRLLDPSPVLPSCLNWSDKGADPFRIPPSALGGFIKYPAHGRIYWLPSTDCLIVLNPAD